MDIKPIKTKADYRAALAEIERLFDAKRGTPEGDRLDVLATGRCAAATTTRSRPPPTRSQPTQVGFV